jgi:hypothetical protein
MSRLIIHICSRDIPFCTFIVYIDNNPSLKDSYQNKLVFAQSVDVEPKFLSWNQKEHSLYLLKSFQVMLTVLMN